MSTPTHYIINIDLVKRLQAKSDITLPTLADRDAIQVWRRKWYMVVGVYNDEANNGFYYLQYNKVSTDISDNSNWTKINISEETDPVFLAWLDTDPLAGFLTEETDPTVAAHIKAITETQISNWDTAHGWGNHALVGYLVAETDPIAMAAIGDRIYTEENYVTSGETLTQSIDELDKSLDGFIGESEELITEELISEELLTEDFDDTYKTPPYTANNYESLRYDTTSEQWIASNILKIKDSELEILTTVDNTAEKVVVLDASGNVRHIEKSTLYIPLKVKDPVVAATTANVSSLSGEQTIDTVALGTGDRVLVWKQTDATENGIYVVAAGAWTRALDTDEWEEFVQAYTLVLGGATYLNTGFFCTASTGGALGDPIHWVQFTKSTEYSLSNVGAGSQVYKGTSGTTFQLRTLLSSDSSIDISQETDTIDFKSVPLSEDVVTNAIGEATIQANVVGNTKLADMAVNTIKGRISAGTGDPEDLTATQARTILNIANGAQVNQNAFSNVAVAGQDTVVADAVTDTLTLVAGDNIVITTDAAADSVTIAADDTNVTTNISIAHAATNVTVESSDGTDGVINGATEALAGVMIATDKVKLDGIAAGAEVNVQSDFTETNNAADSYIQNKPAYNAAMKSIIYIY